MSRVIEDSQKGVFSKGINCDTSVKEAYPLVPFSGTHVLQLIVPVGLSTKRKFDFKIAGSARSCTVFELRPRSGAEKQF